MTVAKSLPRSLRNTYKLLISNSFLFIYRIFDKNNHLIVSYSGGDNNTDAYYPTRLLAFGLDGEYIKTLDVGYKINSMRYDNKTNRIYMNLNDKIQFAYLDLEGLIE